VVAGELQGAAAHARKQSGVAVFAGEQWGTAALVVGG
jgi:hypothetical protein